MSLTDGKAIVGEKKQMTLPKKGPRAAVLTGIIDLGIQTQSYQGEAKPNRQEFIPIFTLLNDTYEATWKNEKGEEQSEVRNAKISPYSLKHSPGVSKGGYVDFYKALDPSHEVLDDKGQGNIYKLIGKKCFVTVKYSDASEDKTGKGLIYPRWGGASEIPEDYPVADLDFDPVIFDTSTPSREIFESLYSKTQDRIRGSVGYAGSELEMALEGDSVPDAGEESDKADDEDAPY